MTPSDTQTAVDCRDESGRERLYGVGGVPIQKVTFKPFETVECVKGRLSKIENRIDRDITKIPGCHRGQEPEPNIGGRGSRRDFDAKRRLCDDGSTFCETRRMVTGEQPGTSSF